MLNTTGYWTDPCRQSRYDREWTWTHPYDITTASTPFSHSTGISSSSTRPRVKLTRREVFRRDNYTCQYCGRRDVNLTVDHVVPRHLGGPHKWTNLVAACSACNHRKGGRKVEEAHMHLAHIPKEPPANAAYIFGRHLSDNGEWEPYISGW